MATVLTVSVIQGPDTEPDWETLTVITEPQYLPFRWSTTDQNVSAGWRVTVPGASGPQQIASGAIQSVPTIPGHFGQFTIDFKQFAPQSPPGNTPIIYDVTVSTYPKLGRGEPISTSLPVKVRYQKSTQPPVVFDEDIGFNQRTIKIALKTLDGKHKDDESTKDEPYVIMVRFRFRTTISAGAAALLPGTLEVGVVGSGGHNNLGHSD